MMFYCVHCFCLLQFSLFLSLWKIWHYITCSVLSSLAVRLVSVMRPNSIRHGRRLLLGLFNHGWILPSLDDLLVSSDRSYRVFLNLWPVLSIVHVTGPTNSPCHWIYLWLLSLDVPTDPVTKPAIRTWHWTHHWTHQQALSLGPPHGTK